MVPLLVRSTVAPEGGGWLASGDERATERHQAGRAEDDLLRRSLESATGSAAIRHLIRGETMKATRRAAAAAALLVLFALGVPAQTNGQIRGKVVDDDEKPLEGVKVQLESPAIGTRTFTTARDGQFRFLTLPPGAYTVKFTRADYADVQKRAVVALDRTVTLNAKMFRVSS
jgi:hypothetical protein